MTLIWWLRSPGATHNNRAGAVANSGAANNYTGGIGQVVTQMYGVAFGFICVVPRNAYLPLVVALAVPVIVKVQAR